MEPDFDDPALALRVGDADDEVQLPDAARTVGFVDKTWYREIVKRARWMDLIGDYAGTERFVLDGEALLQSVLDDPLLAIGVENDPSFQILHAVYLMERTLENLLQRGAIFDVVFFAQTRHLTLSKDKKGFVQASRALARTLLANHLFRHADTIGLAVHSFGSLDDPKWHTYRLKARPMFFMTNDGGIAHSGAPMYNACVLIQRMFLLKLLFHQGISVTLLKGAEFQDAKIFSFVLEQMYSPRSKIPPKLVNACVSALQILENEGDDASRRASAGFKTTPGGVTSGALEAIIGEFRGIIQQEGLAASSPHFNELSWLFILHCFVVPTTGIRQRARKLDALHPDLVQELTVLFLPTAFAALSSIALQRAEILDVDGRLFVSLVHFAIEHAETLEQAIDCGIYARALSVWGTTPPSLHSFSAHFPNPEPSPNASSPPQQLALIPFTNRVFDAELASVHVEVSEGAGPIEHLEFSVGTAFDDVRHWHAHKQAILPKHLGGDAPRPATEWERRRKLRAEQRFMASMQRLATTLTGASGGILQQIVIPPVGDKPRPARKQLLPPAPAQKQQKKAKPGKAPVLTSAEKIRLQKADTDKAKADVAAADWWKQQLAILAALPSAHERREHLQRLARNARAQTGWLAAEFALYRIHLEISEWAADPAAEDASVRDRHTVSLVRQARDAFALARAHPACILVLEAVITCLGLSDYIPFFRDAAGVVPDSTAPKDARPLAFEFVKLLRKSGKPDHALKFMRISEDPVVWQLRLFGEFMDRSMDSQPDARVTFAPDAWQRRVLDCLDRKDSSVLVVAPTSAGKTFISFYAMEKLLKESDTDILVYVSPTKALVNQVAAEVYARFSKDLNGRTCWAVHTRDYRIHDPQKCQILVTVPEMLAIMLLSPPLANTWTPRIKRIILDEIHTIGQHEGGSVWEQIILLAPCPIIGLSATVGEPEAFNTWLESVQKAKGFNHEFVMHPHRYSHLRKFAYFPQLLERKEGKDTSKNDAKTFTGLDSVKSMRNKRFIHPVTALDFSTSSLPPDLSLEASDALSLYKVISNLSTDLLDVDITALDPTAFFPEPRLLTQKDILLYERELKNALAPLLSTSDMQDANSPLRRVVDGLKDPVIAKADPNVLNAPPDKATIRGNMLNLLADLYTEGDLPALLFNFDRNDCEQMLISVCASLAAAEKRWRDTSPEWKRKIEQWEKWKAGAKERQRRAERLKAMKKSADDEPGPVEGQSWESSFDPNEPLPQFCFVGSYTAFSRSDLEEEIDNLRWRGVPGWALEGLSRGIAVHHAGMNRAYRSLVERLFRVRFLQVVIATGTLALGINAPTKTAVFCGDSPFLTALMYRQCAGRAGRRGFDTLGKVVFYGISLDRIYRLMLSRLPRLAGSFPLSSTLTLRLFNLLHGSQYSDYAQQAIRSILQLPQVSFGSDIGRDQLLHHLRFSIDYLRRIQLLGPEGQPINLFGMASHLYYTEPSNFALVALLQSGTIHAICGQSSGVKAQHDIVLLMAHLFGRRYLPAAYSSDDALQELTRKYPSSVVLRPMQEEARAVLRRHQRQILDVFTTYAVTYAEQYDACLAADDTLPLSGMEFKQTEGVAPFHEYLSASSLNVMARSSFVANSGHVDRFSSVHELANTVRRGMHLNEHAIPSLEHLVGTGQQHALNAYLFDFFIHGQTAALANANSIRPGEVWFVLQDFELTLKTVRGGLENLLLRTVVHTEGGDETETDVDSGYFTQDATEIELEEDGAHGEGKRVRPSGVSDRDWRVLEVFDEVVNVFVEKFRAMWA